MNNTIILKTINGLGDKIINLLGAAVYCHYKNYNLKTILNENILYYYFNSHNNYDLSLFNFNNISVYNETNEINPDDLENALQFHNPDTIVSITPYSIYQKLKNEGHDNISFEEVSSKFLQFAKNIQPSEFISNYIPNGIEMAYGIHLRKTDKIKINPDIRHEMTPDENSLLLNKLIMLIEEKIENEENIRFFISSEDNEHKQQFIDSINEIANKKNKIINLISTPENIPKNIKSKHNFDGVFDMFCLSKCKSIVQGVKYSAFSVVASLIGNEKLINLSHYLNSDELCIIYLWNSVIQINDNKFFDKNKYLNIINKYKERRVFYGDIYISNL
jgi:glycerophosphoryl diester phosphodiesterase